jgi:hypothetical protein
MSSRLNKEGGSEKMDGILPQIITKKHKRG